MKFLFLIFSLIPSWASAQWAVEYFDKASNGKQRAEFFLGYQNQSTSLVSVANAADQTDVSASTSYFALNYGYGVSESIAVHSQLAYTNTSIEERNNLSSASDSDTSISGLNDLKIYVLGNHENKSGLFHWKLDLDFSLGNNQLEQKKVGPPAEFEANALAGRTTLNIQFGYAWKLEGYHLGFAVNSDLVQNDADIRFKNVAGSETKLEGKGGKETVASAFFEMPGDQILWGLAFSQHWQEELELKLNGLVTDIDIAKQYLNFKVYSQLNTGPGQELNVAFGYDIFAKSGGNPATEKLDQGSAFSILTSYQVEF